MDERILKLTPAEFEAYNAKCNQKKSSKDPIEYMQECGFLL